MKEDRILTICELKYRSSFSTTEVISEFKIKEAAIATQYPKSRIHKVFISGHELGESSRQKLLKYFDDVVSMQKILF